ncbi:RNA polymerase sigma factor [Haliscomenobacter hydrossis]|uniref:RNA polymerase, sigma-24 subunit, ECF subfamily n=1 Tax=Haliscomenobacter hydrossis (strain ATCC 27775 / DSM 1100 / LMG 10767 / O) TaxID=760192 RepID=F4KUC6_HALH1|nr:RNA polymerase sigma factor [Haliscomenobacter hydrossis]AEE51208.1 RNA polymerase, sigma-24 subunit, ECF subfamily [Haliscomenobacter hydrossis DSM 1100]
MPQAKTSDEQILGLMRNPKTLERGFRLLMDAYQDRLYWQVRRLVTDHDDANDVIQNALVKVFRNIEQFEAKSGLYTWMYRIVTNEAITFLKQRNRRSATSIDDANINLANRLHADSFFDGDEAQIRLQQALQTLPERQKEVFNLRYYEEMSYEDMSKLLNISVGSLKASFHHAVKKVEQFFAE